MTVTSCMYSTLCRPLSCPSAFPVPSRCLPFFFTATATTEIYTLSLHDALPIYHSEQLGEANICTFEATQTCTDDSNCHRSEEHTSELQSLRHLVCRLLLEKKKRRTT